MPAPIMAMAPAGVKRLSPTLETAGEWIGLVACGDGLDRQCRDQPNQRVSSPWCWDKKKAPSANACALAMAVAFAWTVAVGSQADSQRSMPCLERVPPRHVARKRRKPSQEQQIARRLSCPVRGRLGLLAALLTAEEVPLLRLVAEPWPECVTPLKRAVSATKVRQQAQKQARKRRYKAARRRKRAA